MRKTEGTFISSSTSVSFFNITYSLLLAQYSEDLSSKLDTLIFDKRNAIILIKSIFCTQIKLHNYSHEDI